MEKAIRWRKLLGPDSIEELAEFWDTHDLTDFEQDMEEMTEPLFVRAKGAWPLAWAGISSPFGAWAAVYTVSCGFNFLWFHIPALSS
jgi:hypothetical protein